MLQICKPATLLRATRRMHIQIAQHYVIVPRVCQISRSSTEKKLAAHSGDPHSSGTRTQPHIARPTFLFPFPCHARNNKSTCRCYNKVIVPRFRSSPGSNRFYRISSPFNWSSAVDIQSHILNKVSCVYMVRQCEAGLKLVCILVDRASSYSASHCKPSLLHVCS